MAFKHGKNTAVLLGSANVSPYLNAAEFSVDVDTSDTTMFGQTWKTAGVGTPSSKSDFTGLYDPTMDSFIDLLTVDFGTVLTVAPAGALAIGDRARLISVAQTAYAESSPVGGMVACKYAVMGTGAVGDAQVLHLLAEDTNTTTGADKDDGAATTTGWLAHLHVTAVDAGSWVVKLQDAATTDWTDVTGGAFTAATGATSQRLASAAGATLRRHVRYVATRTGGAGGDGITFLLAYSRNN